MNDRLKDILPNPFAVDYQAEHRPLDLYTEAEMFKYAELIIQECCKVIDGHYEPVYDGDILKQYFGVER